MIAGFETPTRGQIRIDGQDVTELRPNQRNIGMVFQSYALFPNMTVADNVGFGLKVAGKPAAEIEARVDEMLAIQAAGSRRPLSLSALGRAAAARGARPRARLEPQVLLLDEPLSALDAKIRVSLREEIRAVQRELGITTIYVTHDQEEALSMSDRIVVMNDGAIEQIGTPFEIYNSPRTRFVASFVGTLNLFKGKGGRSPAARWRSTGSARRRGASSTAPRPAMSARWRCGPRRCVSARAAAIAIRSGASSKRCLSRRGRAHPRAARASRRHRRHVQSRR